MQTSIDQDRRNFAHIAAWCVLVMLLLKFLISLLNNSLYTWIGHLGVETSAFLMCAILIVEKINRNRKTKAINQILALFNHAPCGFHSLDANGVIIAINQTELDWLGYTYEEVVNKINFTDLIDTGSLAIFRENYPKLKKVGFVNELYFNLVAKDGSKRSVLISSVANYDSKGNYHHSLSTVFDISQRKKQEEELRETQVQTNIRALRIHDLYNNAPCGYYSTDAMGMITEINQTALNWLGYTYEEMINKMNIFDLVDIETINKLLSLGPELIEKGFVHEFTCDLIAKDGSLRPILANSIFMYDENGNFLSTRSTAVDITQRKKLEEELKTAAALIKDLYNYAPCGYQSTNSEGIIIEMNQTELDWLGYTYEEVIGKMKITELIDEPTSNMFRELVPEFVRTGSIREIGIDLIRKDGTRLPILFSSIARYDENGNFHSTRATLFDISQRKKLEEELKAAKETAEQAAALIKDLYNNAPCGYQSLDANGGFLEMNQTLLDWLGYTYEEIVHKMKFVEVLDEEGVALFQKTFPEYKKLGKVTELNYTLIAKDGTRRSVLITGKANYDSNGHFKNTRSTVFDITQRIKLEAELRAANEVANLARIAKENFLANMSHEIRTPMNAIIGFTGILERSELADRQKQYVKSIHSASENLLAIVNDILDLSKIEAGMFRIETTPFSLQGLLHSIDAMLQVRAAEKKLHLNILIELDLPDKLLGDPTRLTQILINLIGNAVKFTEQGSIFVQTKVIEHFADNIILQFLIKDTGIGISESQLEYIFDRFEQGDKNTSRLYGGTGLGLSICKRLVDLQGGSIHVTSEPGVGSEFVFTLPYKLPQVEIAEPGFDQVDHFTESSTPDYASSILIVEDNLMNRTLIRFLMEEWSYEHDFAENGEIALEKLRAKPFDLVLMDIQMPKMDGYQAAQIIRNELQLTLPIIAMTAHAFPGEREKCLSAGMDDYIAKPLRQAELRALIDQYLVD